MYARTTTIQGNPSSVEAGIAHVRDVVLPAVTAMEGCIGMSLLVDRESGRTIATTAWESEAAMTNSAPKVLSLRQGAEQVLGASTSDVDAWELAVAHRDHASPEGACARLTYLHLEFVGPRKLYLVAAVDLEGDHPEHEVAVVLRRIERELEDHETVEEAVLTLATMDEARPW